MPIENEPITAEKIRRKKLVAVLGNASIAGSQLKKDKSSLV